MKKFVAPNLTVFAKKMFPQSGKTVALEHICHATESREDLWHYNTSYIKYSLKHVQVDNMAASSKLYTHVTVQCKRL